MTALVSSPGNPSQPLDGLGSTLFASRRRLLLALLLYVVATGGFLAAILALLREDALTSGAALNQSFAQVIEEQTARTVQSVDHLLGQAQRELGAGQASAVASESDMRASFRALLSDLPYVRSMWFIDKEGVIRFDSDEGNIGTSQVDRPYFAQYRQNPTRGLRLNDPMRSDSTGVWFIPVTRPVYDDAGGLRGVAVASLEPAYLDRVWSASDRDDRFDVLFVRRDGMVLMRSPFIAEIMGVSFADRALFNHHLAERPDGTLVDAGFTDEQARLFAYRALGEYSDLVVIVARTLDRVLADWRRFAWLTLGGWLASSAPLYLIAALLIREARRRRAVETDLRRLAAERAAVIDALPAHIALLDGHGAIVAVNAAWRAFGHSDRADGSRGGVGANYLLACDNASGMRLQEAADVAAGTRAVLQGASSSYALEYPCHSPTEQRWFRLMVAPLPDHEAPGAVVMHVDITDRKQDEQLHAAESRVLEMISTGAALPAVLEKLALLFEAILPSTSASIVLLDHATGLVRGAAAPHLPEAFTAAILDRPIGPNAGSCGVAMYRGEQVVADDIDSDPVWADYRDLVRPNGFRSCWSTPILDADRLVLACFAVCFRESKKPTPDDQRLISRAVHLARIAIEHHQKDNELRASAQSLRQSERRFEALANATFDAIWDRDIKADTVWWSDGFKTVFGFTEEEMAERPYSWRKRVHPDDLVRVLASVEDAIRRRQTNWHDEYRFFHQSGRMLYIEDRARFIYDDQEPIRVVGGMTDVTSMHEARQRIDELRNSLRVLVEAANIGILVHRDYKPLLANDELARIFGYASPAEILALPDCRALFAPEEMDRLSGYNVARQQGRDAPGFYAVKGRKKGGARIDLENRAFAIPWEGEVAVCAMLVDVTDRLALEAQLRQVQRLEAVGQLTGGVAHDFNNLLQVILGNAEHLERSLADDESLRQMAELTRVAAERGATLTNRLLAFSRRQALAPKVTDVGAAIAGMSALLRRTLGEQVTVNVVQHATLWRAFIDAPQFESAVLNLGINARDAMPGGGQLTIDLDNVVLDHAYTQQAGEVDPGDYVLVAISDTGEGMVPDVLARAFEPFFTTKDVGKGSGLGLSMVLGFIKQSQGHVKIYSEPGQGTTVKLYLPRAAPGVAAGVTQKREEGPLPGGAERILLVEDDELVRAHAATLLKSLGYDVTTAGHGHEALELLRGGRRFDLLFTDVVMPGGLNGRQLADLAAGIQPDLPVLFTSGYTDSAIVQHGHLEPGANMIAKPYRGQDLARKLRDVLAPRAATG